MPREPMATGEHEAVINGLAVLACYVLLELTEGDGIGGLRSMVKPPAFRIRRGGVDQWVHDQIREPANHSTF